MSTQFFVVRVTGAREELVAKMLADKAKAQHLGIAAILCPIELKGYIVIEAGNRQAIHELIQGERYIRGFLGKVKLSEIEQYIVSKPMLEQLNIGDQVEVISGPFKGMQAKLLQINKMKEEVVIELLEANFKFPITVSASYIGKARSLED